MINVVILAGSESDKWFTDKLQECCEKENLKSIVHFGSAHKKPIEVLNNVNSYKDQDIVFITVAWRSNALSGVVAANTNKTVIACPPFKDKSDFMVNINSTLQMPSGTPVLTVLEPSNAILAVKRILKK